MFNKLSSEGIRGNKAGTLLRKTFERDILKINHLCLKRPGWFMPGEIEKAAKYLGLTLRLFFVMYLGVYRWEKCLEFDHNVSVLAPAILGDTHSFEYSPCQQGACIFFENDLCGIERAKPFGCTISNDKHFHELQLMIAKAWDTPENQKQIFDLLGENNV